MTNHPFALKSPALLRTISGKTLLACIAGVFLASTIAHAELPVAVPETTAAALARIRDWKHSLGGLSNFSRWQFPSSFLFTGLGARLRQMCESISGHRWFWTVTLFACAYLVLAALIALPFDFYLDYVRGTRRWMVEPDLAELAKGRRRATCR